MHGALRVPGRWAWARLVAEGVTLGLVALSLCVLLALILGEFNRVAMSNLAVFSAVLLLLTALARGGMAGRTLFQGSSPDGLAYTYLAQEELLLSEEFREGRLYREMGRRFASSSVMLVAAAVVVAAAAWLA